MLKLPLSCHLSENLNQKVSEYIDKGVNVHTISGFLEHLSDTSSAENLLALALEA